MSYQVLARKWRPKSFETLVGQEHVVRALTHALQTGRLHHAYLFTGTRGVGKTTISRILAKSLNCEKGVTATPCGVCPACTEIDAGRFVDYVEMDAASNRGVDDMAALLEKAAYAPSRGRYKVYMIDEVHMLTGHAFNAMLKTLEEPPEHMKFILATTDPQKIPVTVLSRCLQFNLKQMPQSHIIGHLTHILEEEQVSFEAGALRHIAKGANGSMRDALSLLDQAIAHGAGKVEEAGVRDMLGTVGEDHLYALLDALQTEDIGHLISVADEMEGRSLSFESAMQELATLLHRVALVQFAPQAVGDDFEKEKLSAYAAAFSPEFLQLAYQIVIHGRDELPLAPDEYTGFTMSLLRLHAFRPDGSGARTQVTGPGTRAVPPAIDSRPAPAAGGQIVQKPSVVAPPPEIPVQLEPAVPPEMPAMDVAPASTVETHGKLSPELDWQNTIANCGVGGIVRELALQSELVDVAGNRLRLRLPPEQRHLNAMPATVGKLQEALSYYFREDVHVHVDIGEVTGQTPAQRNAEIRQAQHEEAVASMEADPFVQELIERCDATLVESSVKPLAGDK